MAGPKYTKAKNIISLLNVEEICIFGRMPDL